jgi:hypothetical protein
MSPKGAVRLWKATQLRFAVCALLATLLGAPVSAGEQTVDLELVMATDVSYSVDDNEARLQREGAIAAFHSPDVLKAIRSGALGRIAVAYIVFGSSGSQKVVVNWHVIHDEESAAAFADALAARRLDHGVQTSISSGIDLAARMIEASGFEATAKVIDVSGDGPNNDGRLVEPARDDAIAKGITINGLPIVTEADKFDVYYLPDLDKYYAGCVIGGPHAFLDVSHGFEDFARAIRRKLVLEISDAGTRSREPAVIKVAATSPRGLPRAAYEKGCDIGERMRYGSFKPGP